MILQYFAEQQITFKVKQPSDFSEYQTQFKVDLYNIYIEWYNILRRIANPLSSLNF